MVNGAPRSQRPPVRIRPLFFVPIVIRIVWYPYLHFESSRGFADRKSQFFRQSVLPTKFKAIGAIQLWLLRVLKSTSCRALNRKKLLVHRTALGEDLQGFFWRERI
jgi:hypothetical protein